MINYYDILGVSSSATPAAIKARYRELCKTHHPDVGGSQQHMALLNEAYRILTNPLDRAAFDRARQRQQAANHAARRRAQAARAPRPQKTAPTVPAADIFETAQPLPTKKPSKFWRFIAWGTAAYVVIGLAVLYFVTTPGTAPADTAKTTDTLESSLAKEAADASAAIPATPDTITINQTTSEPAAQDTEHSLSTEPQPFNSASDAQTETSQSNQNNSNSNTKPNNQDQHRLPGWRRLFDF